MPTFVELPKLTLTMEEGTIGKWYKKEGDRVEKGEPLCEVETEKTVDVIEAPASGVLRKIIFPEGSIVPVNKIIAVIAEPDEVIPDLERLIEGVEKAPGEKAEALPALEIEKPMEAIKEEERLKVSPVARKLAEEYGIDLKQIKGTGPEGRIVREDVLKAIEEVKVKVAVAPAVKVVRPIPLTGMRKVIADRLTYSARTALHVPYTVEVDVTEITRLFQEVRSEIEKKTGIRISYTDVLVKAAAEAIREHPIINSMIENDKIKILEDINIGVAVALEDGLIVPVIHNADKKSITEISATSKDLIEKARQKKLLTREASGGTFTVSNLGMFGIDFFAPIINPPESAILGVGRIVKKPVVLDDKITIRSIIALTLVADHRIIDGAAAARFLQTLKRILENPQYLNRLLSIA
jgi:pyruvate dehydrogenase E2 component (dihydrolipoamide acetyltransferase)